MVDAIELSSNLVVDNLTVNTSGLAANEAVIDLVDSSMNHQETLTQKSNGNDEDDMDIRPDILKFADDMFRQQYGDYSDKVMLELIKKEVSCQTAICEQQQAFYEDCLAKEEKCIQVKNAKCNQLKRESELCEDETFVPSNPVQNSNVISSEASVSSDNAHAKFNDVSSISTESAGTTSVNLADSSQPQSATNDKGKSKMSRKCMFYQQKLNEIKSKLKILKSGSKCIHEKRPKPKYIDCYDNANMPPFAKTFYPTAEEFSNPFDYVETIKNEGRHYGVIKIVPPKEFKPPFSLSRDLTFKPRTQRLCITDAFNKEHHMLRAKMVKFYSHDPAKCAVAKFGDVILNLAIFFLSIDNHRVRYNGFEQPTRPCPARSRCRRYVEKVNEVRWIAVANDCRIDSEYAPALEFYYYSVVSKFRAALRVEQILRMRYRKGLSHGLDDIYDTTPEVDGRKKRRTKQENREKQTDTTDETAASYGIANEDDEVANSKNEVSLVAAEPEVIKTEPDLKKSKLNTELQLSSSDSVVNLDQSKLLTKPNHNNLLEKSAQALAEIEVNTFDESGEVTVFKNNTNVQLSQPSTSSSEVKSIKVNLIIDDASTESTPVTNTSKKVTEISSEAFKRIVPSIDSHCMQKLLEIMKKKLIKDDFDTIMGLPEDEKMLFFAHVLKVNIPKPKMEFVNNPELEPELVSDEKDSTNYDDEVEDENNSEIEQEDESEAIVFDASNSEFPPSKPKRKELMFSIYLNPDGETEMVEEEVEVDDDLEKTSLEEQECTIIPFELAEKLLPTKIKAVADAHENKNVDEKPELLDISDDEQEENKMEPKADIDDNDNEIDSTMLDDDNSTSPTSLSENEGPSEAAETPSVRRSSRRATVAAVQKISTITGAFTRPTRAARPRIKRFRNVGPIYEDPDVIEMSKHLPYEGCQESKSSPIVKPVRRRGRPPTRAIFVPQVTPIVTPEEADEEPNSFKIDAEMTATYFKSLKRYTLRRFQDEMNQFKAEYFGVESAKDVDIKEVERAFWKNVGDINSELFAYYGADLNSGNFGSGFPLRTENKELFDAMTDEQKEYAMHPWNLNNMPIAPQSVFHHLEENISGMTIPWVYVGSCFSLFCWHVEDHWTYSINYMHEGDAKVWYGVPEACAAKFDSLMRRLAPEMSEEFPDLMHHMSTMIHPTVLMNHGIRTYTVHQNVGEIVITFPRAYHGGFNAGYNVAEAVNFAPYDWLAQGRLCLQNYAETSRSCVFAHDDLVLSMVRNADRLHPSMYIPICKELSAMFLRDNSFRNFLFREDFKFTRPMISLGETLYNEDVRSCVVCNTLLRGSAIMCKHMRISCPTHYKRICKRCRQENLHFASAQSPFILLKMLHKFVTTYPAWADIKSYLQSITRKLKEINENSTPDEVKTVLLSRRYFPAAKYPVLTDFIEFEKAWIDVLPALKRLVSTFLTKNSPSEVEYSALLGVSSHVAHISNERSVAAKANTIDRRQTELMTVSTTNITTSNCKSIAAADGENIQFEKKDFTNCVVQPSFYSFGNLNPAEEEQSPSPSVFSGATTDVTFPSAHEPKNSDNVGFVELTDKTISVAATTFQEPNETLFNCNLIAADETNDNDNFAQANFSTDKCAFADDSLLPSTSTSAQTSLFREIVPKKTNMNRVVHAPQFSLDESYRNGNQLVDPDSDAGISSAESDFHVKPASTKQKMFSSIDDSSNSGDTPPLQINLESRQVVGPLTFPSQ